jgi:hypothetical protein
MEPTAQRLMFTSSGISGWEVINYLQTNAVADGTNIDFPVGYQAGDSVFAVFLSRASNASSTPSTPTLPSGYRNVQNTSFGGSEGSDRGRLTVYMLNEITTETSFPYTGDNGTANHIVLIILRKPADFDLTKMVVSNIDYAKSVDIDDPDEGDNTPTLPSITTDLDENFIFAIGLTTDTGGAVLSTPTNYTSLVRVSSGIAYNITYRNGVGIGTVNPADMTASISRTSADASIGSTIALRSRLYEYKTNFTNFTTQSVDIGGIVQESTQQTFNAETLDDTSSSFAISISGGNSAEYQINGGSWTSSSGTITKGDTVNVRQTSVTGTSGTTTASTCTLTINGLDYTYTLNTRRELVVSGSATITLPLPNGVNSIYVVGTGAGGSGGGASSSIRGGGGGGGGAMSIIPSLSVSNGQSLVITAGQRTTSANGKGGNSSITISSTTVWRAVGGWGGQTANSTHAGVGGLGGTAEGSIGTIKFSGGNGGDGVVSSNTGAVIGGGGGGAGGYSANGGAGASGNTLPSNDATGGVANVTPSAAATGGAGSGGASACGGGGTGISGEGTSGAAATRGGNEGSPDAYASSGTAFVGNGSSYRDAGDGGFSGGGGGGSPDRAIGNGEDGRIRITW